MKTQISIKVNNENWISRCMSIYMSFGLFIKAKVNMYIDDPNSQPIVLKARREPYIIDLQPGEHAIAFTAKSRAGVDKLIGGAVLGSIGLADGGFMAMAGAEAGSKIAAGLMGHTKVQESLLECSLSDGDLLHISIKPKRNGSVKIKVLEE